MGMGWEGHVSSVGLHHHPFDMGARTEHLGGGGSHKSRLWPWRTQVCPAPVPVRSEQSTDKLLGHGRRKGKKQGSLAAPAVFHPLRAA